MDYLWAVRDFPAARLKREALEKLEALTDTVLTHGAQGETIEVKPDGTQVPPDATANTLKLVGLRQRQNELRAQAGLPPAEEPLTNAQLYVRMRADIEARRRDARD